MWCASGKRKQQMKPIRLCHVGGMFVPKLEMEKFWSLHNLSLSPVAWVTPFLLCHVLKNPAFERIGTVCIWGQLKKSFQPVLTRDAWLPDSANCVDDSILSCVEGSYTHVLFKKNASSIVLLMEAKGNPLVGVRGWDERSFTPTTSVLPETTPSSV